MGNWFSSSELERQRLELDKERLELEKKIASSSELLNKERLELEKKIAATETEFDDNSLYSPWLARRTGLKAPYEQWLLTGTAIGFFVRGVPAIRRGYWSLALERAAEINDLDKMNICLEKLRIDRADFEEASNTVKKQLRGTQVRAVKWGVAGVACALYIARAKMIHDVMMLSKTKK